MTTKTLGKSLFLLFSMVCLSVSGIQTAKAQFGDAGEILRAGSGDANLLLNEYLKPFGAGFGPGLNSGWTETAKPHKTLGFDLKLNVAAAVVPTVDRSFNVDNLSLQGLERVDGSPAVSQTAFGEGISGSELGIFIDHPTNPGQREQVGSFIMPQGAGYPYVPAPMAQLTVGLVKDTDVSLRYMPAVEVDDFSAGLFGFGVKHGLNQWLPGGSLLPVDLSVHAGYTKLTSDFGFDVRPEAANDVYNEFGPETWSGQSIEFEAKGFTGSILVGKTLPILSIYGGVGYQSSEVSIVSPGSYPIVSFNPNYDPSSSSEETREKRIEKIDKPVNLSFDNNSSFHALAGFRIKLAILAITGSYTVSEYPVANLGVGISFR